jgi:phosphopantothenoylcysteine decarboxylase/phosphopantothenate--cysteine ligase
VNTIEAGTVAEMSSAVAKMLPVADVLVMAAAPADFRPAAPAPAKIKKGRRVPKIELEETEDILRSTISKRKKKSIVVGFALETTDGMKNARDKLKSKALDMVILNDATEAGAGFGVDTNRVTIIYSGGKEEALDLMSKTDLAEVLLDRVEEHLNGR